MARWLLPKPTPPMKITLDACSMNYSRNRFWTWRRLSFFGQFHWNCLLLRKMTKKMDLSVIEKLQVGCLVVALGLGGIAGTAAVAQEPVRIMPLGDSITQGRRSQPGYRPILWRRLAQAGYRVDFVGSLHATVEGSVLDGDFDADHEGHWGWRADEVLARIDGWTAAARPDVVLLHIGTNDIGGGEHPDRTAAEVEQIIVRLRARNPQVHVLLATIIPLVYDDISERIREFNARLEDLARALDTPRSRIVLVDHYTDFDARRDTYDGLHPNPSGAARMADEWFEALSALVGPPG